MCSAFSAETDPEEAFMAIRVSTKRGTKSTSRKMASSRHGTDPMPATQAVAGAFGLEGRDRKTPRPAGRLRPHPASTGGASPTRGPVGISNRPLKREMEEQHQVPPRRKAKVR
jgi:hypothetical protein